MIAGLMSGQIIRGGRMSKVFYKSPDKQKAKYILKLSSYNAGRMVRLLSGHNNLGYFQNLLNPDVSPTCRLCEEETETFEHWITECPVLRQARMDILKVVNVYQIIPVSYTHLRAPRDS